MTDDTVQIQQAEIQVAGGTIDGWRAELGGCTGTGHGREEALRNLAMNLWRESL